MEQIKIQDRKQVKINGVRQNCYVSDALTALQGMTTIKPEEKFYTLERQQLPNGFVEGIELKDYPINSASVTSYADGADYRNDPAQAIANAPKRVNLGDVSQVQEFLQSDPQNAVRVLRDVVAHLKAVSSNESAVNPAAEPAVNPAAEPAVK